MNLDRTLFKSKKEERNKLRERSKALININTKETFNSAVQASKNYNICSTSITKTCRGAQKTAGGYKWMYKEDYDKYIANASN